VLILDDKNIMTQEERYKVGNQITWITIIINIILAVVKVVVGILFNSTAISFNIKPPYQLIYY